MGDAPVLIDTVKAPFMDEMMARIASVCPPETIDRIVSNHSEMDHTGCLPEVIARVRPREVLASKNGVAALSAHFGALDDVRAVADGERIDVGGLTLSFYETRMLHWPDSMVTYLAEDKLLFSQDAFGMHLASTERFDDALDRAVLEFEAGKYFANILMPYAGIIPRALAKLSALEFSIIAPDHGPVWRRDPRWILDAYARWSEQAPTRKAVIVYDTMWESTAVMAQTIADGIEAGGAEPKLMRLSEHTRAEVATELLEAGSLVVGSPTLNNGVFPTVADVLTYLKGLRPKNLVGAAFGSYGWSGEAVEQLNEYLRAMKVALVSDGLKVAYVPGDEDLEACHRLGRTIGAAVLERAHAEHRAL